MTNRERDAIIIISLFETYKPDGFALYTSGRRSRKSRGGLFREEEVPIENYRCIGKPLSQLTPQTAFSSVPAATVRFVSTRSSLPICLVA